MKYLDVPFGVIFSSKNNLGFSGLDKFESVMRENEITRKKEVTLRDFVFGLIGSSVFTNGQKTAIDRLYDEFGESIDVIKHEKFISKNTAMLLPTVSVSHALKLYFILDHILDFDVPVECVNPTIRHTDVIAIFNLDLQALKGYIPKENQKLINQVLIKVFKGVETLTFRKLMEIREDVYGGLMLETLKAIISAGGIFLPHKYIFAIFAYAYGDYLATDNDIVFYHRSDENRQMAERILKRIRRFNLKDVEEEQLEQIVRLSKHFTDKLYLDEGLELAANIGVFMTSVGYWADVLRLNTTGVGFMQIFNNIASDFNLSTQFISVLPDSIRKEALRKSIYLSATFNDTEESIVNNVPPIYGQYILLYCILERHKEDIKNTYAELKNWNENKKYELSLYERISNLEQTVISLKNDLYNKHITTSKKDLKEVHMDYYHIIKDLTKTIETLENQVDEYKSKYSDKLELEKDKDITLEDIEVDISDKKLIVVGHIGAEDTINQLKEHVALCDFIDGSVKSNTITPLQLQKYDLLLLQWQFIPHTVNKFKSVAKNEGVPICYLSGTNIERWLEQIKESFKDYRVND